MSRNLTVLITKTKPNMCPFTYLNIPLCCAGFTDIYKLICIKYKVVQQDARLFLAHCGTVPKTDELNQFKISLHRSADGVSAFTCHYPPQHNF